MTDNFINKFPFARIAFWLVMGITLLTFVVSNQLGFSNATAGIFAGISFVVTAIIMLAIGVKRTHYD